MFNSINRKTSLLVGIVCVFLYVLPLFILGDKAHIRIHDNLDSNLVLYKILSESGKIFSSNNEIIPNMLNGLPRGVFPSEFSVQFMLYIIFNPLNAFLINQFLIRIIGFIGFLFLLRTHVFKNENNGIVVLLVSILYAIIPFYPTAGASVSGIPLLLYSFLNFRKENQNLWDYVIICFLSLYMSFILSSFFIVIVIIYIFIYDLIYTKQINKSLFIALTIFIMLSILTEYRLLLTLLNSNGFISHRIEYNKVLLTGDSSFNLCVKKTFTLLFNNYDPPRTFPIFHREIILPSIVYGLIVSIKDKNQYLKKMLLLILIMLTISFIYGFYYYQKFTFIFELIPLLNQFNLWRFQVFLPFLWYLLFAFSLNAIYNIKKIGCFIVYCIAIAQMLLLIYNSDELLERRTTNLSFSQFYSSDLFHDIKTFLKITPPSYKVVSVGLHPAVSLFNGFYTLDGYYVNYPVEYKHEFRKIIQNELFKNETIKKYYDYWGNRVYIFTDEHPFVYWNIHNNKELEFHNLDLDYEVLKNLGCNYIISAITINNKDNKLRLLNTFEDKESPYKIRLYEIR